MLRKLPAVLVMFYAAAAMAAVDVNKANERELDAVRGLGPVTTKAILDERKKSDFRNWQDLIDRVKGIGDARAARLSKEGVTVNGEPYRAAAASRDARAKAAAAPASARK